MDTGIISARYAKALFIYAQKHGQESRIYDETLLFIQSCLNLPVLRRALSNPVIKPEQKIKLLLTASGKTISPEFENFIRLLVRQKRENYLLGICFIYQEYFREKYHILNAILTTAVDADADTQEKIKKKLEKLTGKKIVMLLKTDPNILGGYIVHWDTYRWDNSLRSQLKRIKNKIGELTIPSL